MKVVQLTLRNFRNVEESTLAPDPHLNFLIGSNGQGKTSFLEAISYLATLRSFRGAKSDEIIRYGETGTEVICRIRPDDLQPDWETELKLVFQSHGLPQEGSLKSSRSPRVIKSAFINGKPFKSSTQYLSQRFGQMELGFHAIVFNPSDHDLIRGEPALRRSYLDRVLSAEDLEYLKILQKYQRVLEQRNSLLKSDLPVSRDLLAGFSEPLAHYGSLIAYKRLQWIERLNQRINETLHHIAPRERFLTTFYASNWVPEIQGLSIKNNNLESDHFAGQQHQASLELLEQAFWKQLSLLESKELHARSSLVGPHRDDWVFCLGGHFLKGHGSQGEVRSALLALKLSEIELFREQTGHQPLLLLDDFSSELDQERRGFLLSYLKESPLQSWVTTTEDGSFLGKRVRVSGGKLFDESKQEEMNDHTTE